MKINQRLTLCFSLLFCLLSISYASAQQLNISGVVISSEDNEPLIGATVSVKGNPTKGVITDINGQFQLSVETGTKMLVVSYVGMKTQEIRVPRKEKELKIVLIPETMDIDEVVVTGYGNFSKSSFTGSANWIALQDYQHTDWNNLIQLWKFFNLHIIQVIKSVDQTKLDSYWCDFEGTKITLKEMIEGYLDHLNLHIQEIHELI